MESQIILVTKTSPQSSNTSFAHPKIIISTALGNQIFQESLFWELISRIYDKTLLSSSARPPMSAGTKKNYSCCILKRIFILLEQICNIRLKIATLSNVFNPLEQFRAFEWNIKLKLRNSSIIKNREAILIHWRVILSGNGFFPLKNNKAQNIHYMFAASLTCHAFEIITSYDIWIRKLKRSISYTV